MIVSCSNCTINLLIKNSFSVNIFIKKLSSKTQGLKSLFFVVQWKQDPNKYISPSFRCPLYTNYFRILQTQACIITCEGTQYLFDSFCITLLIEGKKEGRREGVQERRKGGRKEEKKEMIALYSNIFYMFFISRETISYLRYELVKDPDNVYYQVEGGMFKFRIEGEWE